MVIGKQSENWQKFLLRLGQGISFEITNLILILDCQQSVDFSKKNKKFGQERLKLEKQEKCFL